jgi:hypothetical protein
MSAAHDLTNVVQQKMTALGLNSVECASRYSNLGPTQFRRMLGVGSQNGFAQKLEDFNKTLDDLLELKQKFWPCPLDFKQVGRIQVLLHRFRNNLTQITNVDDSKPPTAEEIGAFEALGKKRNS